MTHPACHLCADCQRDFDATYAECERLRAENARLKDTIEGMPANALKVEGENARLTGYLDDADKTLVATVARWEAEVTALRARADAGEADTVRVDWLESQMPNITVRGALAVWAGNSVSIFAPFGQTLANEPALARAETFRAAIDAARGPRTGGVV